MSNGVKTSLTVEKTDDGAWLVSVDAHWPDGEQFFSFAIKHPIAGVSVSELERSAIALMRDHLGRILGMPDRSP